MYEILLIPILIITVGYIMYKYPPKKINIFIGYRTKKSMVNDEKWKLANSYCGKLWMKYGFAELVGSIIIWVLFYLKLFTYDENILALLVVIQVLVIFIPIFIVENKLRNNEKS